jgi:hypothetical protein
MHLKADFVFYKCLAMSNEFKQSRNTRLSQLKQQNLQNFSYFLNESKSRSHLLMHFCSPPFRLSTTPKRSAISTSGNSEKHVALHTLIQFLPPSQNAPLLLLVCVKFGRFQKPRFSICFVTETPHTISKSNVHPLQLVLPAVTGPNTLGVVFYALGILV